MLIVLLFFNRLPVAANEEVKEVDRSLFLDLLFKKFTNKTRLKESKEDYKNKCLKYAIITSSCSTSKSESDSNDSSVTPWLRYDKGTRPV